MTKVRQDAWSHEDDLLLAETVLRHIREGSTQLDAFEEVGDRLNRTGAACGFRWNAIVRRKYEQAIEIAKKQRKQKKRAEQRGRTIHPVNTPAFHVMETAALSDPSEPTYAAQSAQPEQSSKVEAPAAKQTLSMTDVIHYLQSMQKGSATSDRLDQENTHLKEENNKLQMRVKELEQEVVALTKRQQTVEDDYQALIGIMDRARRMVAFQDQNDSSAPAFKMDENGNLEKIAK
ncbi:RsfA family transcriptional regulator [Sporolactobacillus shoreicorticis]|uniref:RsfA family transcriptional regulator n=1 Tax=Sporolactobacillus shoreicorticis TaxID=1923877 RepID=A0ABW5S529_9BACL|nr:RsfA family transcriptional regulator [Sporolactobacillus shoreicorticis]MCO7126392.1 RsfA family transcriptional regulator [Sporolactobacillus shoreicorticis]